MTVFGGAGGRNNEGRMQVDGLNTGAGLRGSSISTYVADTSNAQEVVTMTSGGLGEAAVGGSTLSIIPKSGGNTIDVLVSGTLRSDQGAPLAANWNAPVALVSAALGRPAAVVGTTVPIRPIAPGEKWGDCVNAVDLRFAKILRFGRAKYNVGIDIYNVLNSDATLTYNQNFVFGGRGFVRTRS